MAELDRIGIDWMIEEVQNIVDEIIHVTPSAFNEENRFLPDSVTAYSGYIRYSLTPYLREIVDCFDVDNDIREINIMKGVQVGYTSILESAMLYFMAHVKSIDRRQRTGISQGRE